MNKLKHILTRPGEYRKLYAAGATFLVLLLNTLFGPDAVVVDLVLALLGAAGVQRLPNDPYTG